MTEPARVFVKICGLTSAAAVDAAVEAGADALGFVLAESPRRLEARVAARLAAQVPPGIVRVAVFRHPDAETLRAALGIFAPDWLQADAAAFDAFDPPARVERLPVYRDAPGLDRDRLRREPRVLFEGQRSGAGERPDWQLATALARSTRLILAGGLDPDNVGEAVATVRPWGVDVSSGVEASPGVKDAQKIRAFVAAVRRAEGRLDDR